MSISSLSGNDTQNALAQLISQVLHNHSGGGSKDGLNAQSASGALASYMNQNGVGALDMNDLYKLATNQSGDTPETVQQAAQYMLDNPDVYSQIETHDVAGEDGKSGVGNFDWAAQGGLADGAAAQGGTAGGGAAATPAAASWTPSQSGGGIDLQGAAGALASYMNQHGIGALDMNGLYKLATDKAGDTPETVQQAAQYMLQHPDEYGQLETHDVAGRDGKSGVGNFEWAAQGGEGEGAAPAMAGGTGGRGAVQDGDSGTSQLLAEVLQLLQQNYGNQSYGNQNYGSQNYGNQGGIS